MPKPGPALLVLLAVCCSKVQSVVSSDSLAQGQKGSLGDATGMGWLTRGRQSKTRVQDFSHSITMNSQSGDDGHQVQTPAGSDSDDVGSSSSSPEADVSDSDDYGAIGNPALYSNLKFSVVRVSTVNRAFNVEKPYEDMAVTESVGSGFIVDASKTMENEDDYTIITNAHVVRGSEKVRVQLPSLGRHLFDATVPMICFEFDLAIIKLKDPAELKAMLKKLNVQVTRLKLQSKFVKMGMKVAALGFPLGSQWLKLSEGVVSGAESVEDNMVYQSTAPISPGNSGGPLLVFRSEEGQNVLDTVVGVNFASSASESAQNLNYVVPAFRIVQILVEYEKMVSIEESEPNNTDALDQFGKGTREHMELRIAPTGALYTQTTQAQLKRSKCKNGVQLDRLLPYSVFRWSTPPIQERSFLTKVDDTQLDTFGMGKHSDFMQQYVSFKDLLSFRSSLDEGVIVTTCMDGRSAQHTLSLNWNTTRYSGGVKYVYEPTFDDTAKDYEIFAGVTMTQLTLNHIDKWSTQQGGETLGRFYLQENTIKPCVAISACSAGSSCEDIVGTGMIVGSINGCEVFTLDDVRKCFTPPENTSTWQLVTDRGYILLVDFQQELNRSIQTAGKDVSLLSRAVQAAAKKAIDRSNGETKPASSSNISESVGNATHLKADTDSNESSYNAETGTPLEEARKFAGQAEPDDSMQTGNNEVAAAQKLEGDSAALRNEAGMPKRGHEAAGGLKTSKASHHGHHNHGKKSYSKELIKSHDVPRAGLNTSGQSRASINKADILHHGGKVAAYRKEAQNSHRVSKTKQKKNNKGKVDVEVTSRADLVANDEATSNKLPHSST